MRIKELRITSGNLSGQVHFYEELLGFKMLSRQEGSASFQIGKSRLTLVSDTGFTPYHFAFNIPANQDIDALHWLRERVNPLAVKGEAIQDFSAWNARAIYFHDADQNIVEFIARRNLDNRNERPFEAASCLEISEIGIATADVKEVHDLLKREFGLGKFDGNLHSFCAVGDENGLFICLNRNKNGWFPHDDTAFPSEFYARFAVGKNSFSMEYSKEKINALT